MSGNMYEMGSLEWHAWGNGYAYGLSHYPLPESPLSGEWADGPHPRHVVSAAWRDVMGESWDAYVDGSDDDRDGDDAILTAWEEGAAEGAAARWPSW